nr:hypothetical protein [bacterium]
MFKRMMAVFALLAVVCLPGCGKKTTVEVDLTSPRTTLNSLMGAFVAVDEEALSQCMTSPAFQAVTEVGLDDTFKACMQRLEWNIISLSHEGSDSHTDVSARVHLKGLDYSWIIDQVNQNSDIGTRLEAVLEQYSKETDQAEIERLENQLVSLTKEMEKVFVKYAADPACPTTERDLDITLRYMISAEGWVMLPQDEIVDTLMGRDPISEDMWED